jgi:hypothetical protein
MKKRKGHRGKHKSPRRLISAAPAQLARWDAAAALTWPGTFATWARDILTEAANTQLAAADIRADIHPRTSAADSRADIHRR